MDDPRNYLHGIANQLLIPALRMTRSFGGSCRLYARRAVGCSCTLLSRPRRVMSTYARSLVIGEDDPGYDWRTVLV
jgi:hypothetical protein